MEIRQALREKGRIAAKEEKVTSLRTLGLTDAQKGDFANYEAGQVIRFGQNVRNFVRGEKVTVTGIGRDRVSVTKADGSAGTVLLKDAKWFELFREREIGLSKGDKVRITQNGFTRRRGLRLPSRLDNGSIYEVASVTDKDIHFTNGFVVPKDYGGLTHGYATTSHASQGKTVDKVFIALGQESFAAANREQFYVSVSRGREGLRLYTNDKAAMLDAIRESDARMSASELLDEPKRKPPIMARLMDMQRIKRAYEAVRARLVPEVRRAIGY